MFTRRRTYDARAQERCFNAHANAFPYFANLNSFVEHGQRGAHIPAELNIRRKRALCCNERVDGAYRLETFLAQRNRSGVLVEIS